VPPVSTIRATFGQIALAAETYTAVPAVTGSHLDFHAIDKHDDTLCGHGHDIDPPALAVEQDRAVDQGKQRVIVPLTHVATGMKTIPYLADQDIASADRLPAKFFDTATLSVRVATVATGTLSLFMGHNRNSPIPSPETNH
jgi:hypothetical protein